MAIDQEDYWGYIVLMETGRGEGLFAKACFVTVLDAEKNEVGRMRVDVGRDVASTRPAIIAQFTQVADLEAGGFIEAARKGAGVGEKVVDGWCRITTSGMGRLEQIDATTERSRDTVTLLFTDIVGSTVQSGELGDRRWQELLQRHNQ